MDCSRTRSSYWDTNHGPRLLVYLVSFMTSKAILVYGNYTTCSPSFLIHLRYRRIAYEMYLIFFIFPKIILPLATNVTKYTRWVHSLEMENVLIHREEIAHRTLRHEEVNLQSKVCVQNVTLLNCITWCQGRTERYWYRTGSVWRFMIALWVHVVREWWPWQALFIPKCW